MRLIENISALVIGCAIGVGFTMALGRHAAPVEAGDWLQFTGALVGVVVTILGTLWLNHQHAEAQERRNRQLVIGALREVETTLASAREPRGNGPFEVVRPARMALEQRLIAALDKFAYARPYVPPHDIDAWLALEALSQAIVRERSMIEHECRLIDDNGTSDAVLNINIAKVGDAADRLTPFVASALEEMEN